MKFELLIEKLEKTIAEHLSEHGEEGMVMPYPLHWVICLSVADATQERHMTVRAVAPFSQPHYVSIGLLTQSIDMISYGETLQDDE